MEILRWGEAGREPRPTIRAFFETQRHGGTEKRVATRRQTVGYQSTVISVPSALGSVGEGGPEPRPTI
jgi:hypothetical protein